MHEGSRVAKVHTASLPLGATYPCERWHLRCCMRFHDPLRAANHVGNLQETGFLQPDLQICYEFLLARRVEAQDRLLGWGFLPADCSTMLCSHYWLCDACILLLCTIGPAVDALHFKRQALTSRIRPWIGNWPNVHGLAIGEMHSCSCSR